MGGEQREDRVRPPQGLLQDVRTDSLSFRNGLLTFWCDLRKKAFEKKRREEELAATDKARGEDVLEESSVQLGLLAI